MDSALHTENLRPGDRLDRQLRWLGYTAVAACGLVAALLIWYGLTAEAPLVGLVLPLVALGALVVVLAQPSPTARLATVLLASTVLLTGDAGFSAIEVLFGLGAMAYLAAWSLHATFAAGGVLRSSTDLAAATWCTVGIFGGVAIGILSNSDVYAFRADLQAALFFPFYFPLKEMVRRDERGPFVALCVFIGIGLFAAIYNAVALRAQLASATAIYEVVDVRVADGMMQVSAGILLALAALATPQRRLLKVVLLGALAIFLVGLVTGKSRAYWVAVALGIGILGVLLGAKDRRRLIVFLGVGVASVVGLAVVLVGDQLLLIGAGALDRLLSLAGAGRDISLVNRFIESGAALDKIRVNPILGHGWGSMITHYSLVSYGTTTRWFIHNGYVAMWFKLGLWGLALMTYVWFSTLIRGVWTARLLPLEPAERALLTGSVAALTVFAITALTSNPFSIMDQMLTIALLMGAANGVSQRASDRRHETSSAEMSTTVARR